MISGVFIPIFGYILCVGPVVHNQRGRFYHNGGNLGDLGVWLR